jgi:hypothetical protein
MLGITRAEKQAKRNLGIYDNPMWKATHAVPNAERRLKRRVGYYSTPMKWFRLFRRIVR